VEIMPWWVVVIAFGLGGVFGMLLTAVLTANERDDRP